MSDTKTLSLVKGKQHFCFKYEAECLRIRHGNS